MIPSGYYLTMLRILKRCLYLLLPLILLSACTHWWEVRPYSDFVAVEVQPGDQIRIKTRDGERIKMLVVEVKDDRIVGENQTILLSDIEQLEKRSENPPANPCSPQVPLGCSTPQWATLIHDSQAIYTKYFYPSCEQHDYCYRHGTATYGMGKDDCDYQFLQDMQAQCQPDDIVDLLLQASSNFTTCNAVAMEFYVAVQQYGANRFNANTSTYCEYDGPP
jgi:hypothetical protein